MVELHKIIRVSHLVACSIVFVLFDEQSSQGRVLRVMKKIIFSSFSRLGHFPQAFLQMKKWLILELHETIRILHTV